METSKAYLLGRLLAVLDHVGAVRDSHTTAERLYGEAVQNPGSLVRILQVATTNYHTDWVQPIMTAISPGEDLFGSTALTEDEQGEFALGYYHQRADLAAGLRPGPDNPRLFKEERGSRDATLTFRLSSELKSWVKSNGGDALIRALLIEERARRGRMA